MLRTGGEKFVRYHAHRATPPTPPLCRPEREAPTSTCAPPSSAERPVGFFLRVLSRVEGEVLDATVQLRDLGAKPGDLLVVVRLQALDALEVAEHLARLVPVALAGWEEVRLDKNGL